MVLLQDLGALFHNFSLRLKLAFKIWSKPRLCRDFKIAHHSMACIAVYQDNGANLAIETIPPVSAQLW